MENQLTLFIDDTEKEHIEFRYEITSYGADYPVDSLVKRIENGTIFVPPFQRRYVWDIYEASKFVESLILGLPVPGVFLSKEQNKNNNLLIVDGQQRLLTLYFFYKNQFKGKSFRLSGVQNDLENKSYAELALSDKNRLDDSIIHATVIKQDQPDDGESSIYQIFERINSAGRALSPQEIRACIYHGKYNELLVRLTANSAWRSIIGAEHNERLKEEELILRFFSLYYSFTKYRKPMKDFLNKSMSANRNLEIYSDDELTNLFGKTISVIGNFIGISAFRVQRGLHSAILDSVMVGIAKRLERGPIEDHGTLRKAYASLIDSDKFIDFITSATSDETSTIGRINLAVIAFESVR